jgi:phosphohistidine phosphatase
MKIYLCRHGEAVDGSDDVPDELRWLTAEGRRGVADVGAALRDEGEEPDLILTSPLVRAVQTADVLAQAVRYKGEVEVLASLAPGGRLGVVVAALQELGEDIRAVYLVGHEPQMSDWTAALSSAGPSIGSFRRAAWPD